ncbi:glycosyltransferase [Cereibacter sp. SYSU M97828]|nr:glycosyltransferase [Cereibacter flavus]
MNIPMRLALICPPYPSHRRAFDALGRALVARGHLVTVALAEGEDPAGAADILRIGPPTDTRALRSGAIGQSIARTEALCAAAARFRGADAIIGDQTEPASALIAAHLGVPLISVACALPFDGGPGIPPPFLGWPFDPSERGLRRNAGGARVADLILFRQNLAIRRWAKRLGVVGIARAGDCVSPLLTLSQTLPGFDHPRGDSPVVELGPLRDAAPPASMFEPPRGQPFVYASLGTLQGHRWRLLQTIAAGCRDAGARVLVSHGGGLSPQQARDVGADWIFDHVPQEAMLDRAALCITHGGLNTAMEALERHVPLVVIPLAFDQFGVAARVERHGVGLRLGRHFLSRGAVRQAVERILRDPSFGRNAQRFGPGPGMDGAIRLIEERLRISPSFAAAR